MDPVAVGPQLARVVGGKGKEGEGRGRDGKGREGGGVLAVPADPVCFDGVLQLGWR